MEIFKKLFLFKAADKPEKFELSESNETEFDVRNEETIKKEYVNADFEKKYFLYKKKI